MGYVHRDTQFNISSCTNIDEEKQLENKIIVFPNPTNNYAEIGLVEKENYTIQLYDIMGNILISEIKVNNNYTLNLGNMAQGIYFLKVTDSSNTSITKKIIKQ